MQRIFYTRRQESWRFILLLSSFYVLALLSLSSSSLPLYIKLILSMPLLGSYGWLYHRFIPHHPAYYRRWLNRLAAASLGQALVSLLKSRQHITHLAYYGELSRFKRDYELARGGWRVKIAGEKWQNAKLESHNSLFDLYLLLGFSVNHKRIYLPLIKGDIPPQDLRALRVLLKYNDIK